MTTYFVQAIYAHQFADLYVQASSPEAAIAAARKICPFPVRWTRFAI